MSVAVKKVAIFALKKGPSGRCLASGICDVARSSKSCAQVLVRDGRGQEWRPPAKSGVSWRKQDFFGLNGSVESKERRDEVSRKDRGPLGGCLGD